MSNAAEADSPAAALEARLRQVLGNEHVLTDPGGPAVLLERRISRG